MLEVIDITKIRKDPKTNLYFFVLEAGRDPFTQQRKQKKRKGFKSQAEAKAAMKKLLVEMENSTFDSSSLDKAPLSMFAKEFLNKKKISVSYATYFRLEHSVKLIDEYFNKMKMSHVDERVLEGFIRHLMEKKGLAPTSTRRVWIALKGILKIASRKKAFDYSLTEDVSLPKVIPTAKFWEDEHFEKFLNAEKFIDRKISRHYNACALALLTGMRKQEILGLKWKDIDYENKKLYIRRTVVQVEGGFDLADKAKTQTSLGQVDLPDKALAYIDKQREQVASDKEFKKDSYEDNDLIFCARNGKVLTPKLINNGFDILIKQLGLPKIRFHDLRHSHATYLMSKGVNPKIVQERLRHKSIKTTLDVYSHASPTMQKEAASIFDKSFK